MTPTTNKDFQAMLNAQVVQPLSAEEREKLRVTYGNSWKFSVASRYEATIARLEREVVCR